MSLVQSTYVRTRSIGGSDAAAVMGVSRYKTPAEVYDDIVGHAGPRPPTVDGGPTERGNTLEPMAAALYQRTTDLVVRIADKQYGERHPFLHASPDRLLWDRATHAPVALLEIKCPGTYMLRKWKEEGVPVEYLVQMQHYLFVLGLPRAVFCALDYDAWDVWVVDVPRDEPVIAQIVDRCTTFWLDYVERGVRPPDVEPVGVAPAVESLWPKGRPGAPATRDDEPWKLAMHELTAAVTDYKLAEARLEHAKESVKAMMGEQEEVSGGGLKIVWHESTSSTFDRKAFAAANPTIDLSKYMKSSATRPFNIYPLKEK